MTHSETEGGKMTRGKSKVSFATEIRGDWDRSGNARYTLVGVKEVDAPTARFFKNAVAYESALVEILEQAKREVDTLNPRSVLQIIELIAKSALATKEQG